MKIKNLLLVIALMSGQIVFAQSFEKEYVNPHKGYSDAIVITQNNTKTIYIAGQVGEGSSLEAQIRVAFQRLLSQLAQCGADFKDVVKHTTYIKDYKDEDLIAFRKVREELFGDQELMPPNVLVGVASLFREDILVEMDAIAIIQSDD